MIRPQRKRARGEAGGPGGTVSRPLHLKGCFDQRAELAAMGGKPGDDIAERWFRMKFYDDLSDLRPEKQGYYKHYVHEFVTRYFTPRLVAGKRVLDFGCGPGFYSAILGRLGARVTGIDLSPFLIQKANWLKAKLDLNGLDFVRGDFVEYASKLPQESFDFVIAIDTFVSFDYSRTTHDHERVRDAFRGVSRILKASGRCFVIESHPFFGRVFQEIASDTGEALCVRSPHYRIEHRMKTDVHHWFTLEEMTRATSEGGLAVLRIHEPDPAPVMQRENPVGYSFRLKYPGLIVYELSRLPTDGR